MKFKPLVLFGLILILVKVFSETPQIFISLRPQLSQHLYLILLAFSLVILNLYLKAIRTKYFISSYSPTNVKKQFSGLTVGYFFDSFLPLRSGQLIRAYYLSKIDNISLGFTLIAIVTEKSLDILAILLTVTLFGLSQNFDLLNSGAYIWLLSLSFALLVVYLIFTIVKQHPFLLKIVNFTSNLLNEKLAVQFRHSVWSASFALQGMVKRKNFVKRYVLLTIMSWICYIGAILLLIKTFTPRQFHFNTFSKLLLEYGFNLPFQHLVTGSGSKLASLLGFPKDSLTQNQIFILITWLLLYPLPIFYGFINFVKFIFHPNLKNPQNKKYILDSYNDESYNDRNLFIRNYFANNVLYLDLHRQLFLEDIKIIKYFRGGSDAITLLIEKNNVLTIRKCIVSNLKTKLEKQYLWLSSVTNGNFVQALQSGETSTYYFYEMDFLDKYERFHLVIHQQSLNKSKLILQQIFNSLSADIYGRREKICNTKGLLNFVDETFFSKISQVITFNPSIGNILEAETLIINGRTLIGPVKLMNKILSDSNIVGNLSTITKVERIHGDLTVDNLLIGPNGNFKIIDPSDDNSFTGLILDISRMQQSLKYGYEFLFHYDSSVNVEILNDIPKISFLHINSKEYAELSLYLQENIVPDLLPIEELPNIDFHTALFYFRMLPHQHRNDPESVLKFLSVGIICLNEYWDNLNV